MCADPTEAQCRSLPVLLLALHAKFARTCTKYSPTQPYTPFSQRCATCSTSQPPDGADAATMRRQRQRLLDEIGTRHVSAELEYLFSGAHIIESCLDRLCVLSPAADAALGALALCPEVLTNAFDLGPAVERANQNPNLNLNSSVAQVRRAVCTQPDIEDISNVPTPQALAPNEIEREFSNAGSSSRANASGPSGLSSITPVGGMDVEASRRQAILAKMAERQRRFMRLMSGEDARPSTATSTEAASSAASISTSSSTTPKPVAEATEPTERQDSAPAQEANNEEADALMCTCVVCSMTTCVDPTRADEGAADPNDPLGLVALVQQGGVHLHRPAALHTALRYELPLANDPSVNHAQAELAKLKMDHMYEVVGHKMAQCFGQVRALAHLVYGNQMLSDGWNSDVY